MNDRQKFIVQGGKTLAGSIRPAGNKNEALPLLAASLLTEESLILHNIPQILDVFSMNQILQFLGVEISYLKQNSQQLKATNIKKKNLELHQNYNVKKYNASFSYLG